MSNARGIPGRKHALEQAGTGCAPYLASCKASSTTMVVLLGVDSV